MLTVRKGSNRSNSSNKWMKLGNAISKFNIYVIINGINTNQSRGNDKNMLANNKQKLDKFHWCKLQISNIIKFEFHKIKIPWYLILNYIIYLI